MRRRWSPKKWCAINITPRGEIHHLSGVWKSIFRFFAFATAGERKMQPDYLAFNSMSFSNGANRDTELQVIVYQYWNADEVVAEIEAIMVS